MVTIAKNSYRNLFTGLLPLFIFAHFAHHVVGALLRPLMPMIRTDLGLSYTEVGFVTSAFAVTGGIAQLPAGFLADRFGARLMVVLGVSGVAVTGLLIGISNSYVMLIVLLILAALLGGGYHPASATAIAAVVPAPHRGRALGLHLIGGSSAFWVVPLIGAPIAALAWGWQGAFLTLSIPTLIVGVILYILIGKQADKQKALTPATPTAVGTGPTKVNWRALLPFLLMSVAAGTMLQSVSGYLSLYAVDELKVSEAAAALMMSVTPLVGLVGAPLGGYLSDRFGGIPVMITVSVATVPLIFLLGVAATVPAFVVVMVALGLTSNTRMPTSESYIIGNIPEKRRSTILGLYFFAGAEISGLMTPVMGKLIDSVGFQRSFALAAITSGIITVICIAIIWLNSRQKKQALY